MASPVTRRALFTTIVLALCLLGVLAHLFVYELGRIDAWSAFSRMDHHRAANAVDAHHPHHEDDFTLPASAVAPVAVIPVPKWTSRWPVTRSWTNIPLLPPPESMPTA